LVPKRPGDPGQQQPEAEQEDEIASCRERPPFEADFPQGPAECRENDDRVGPKRRDPSPEQQERHHQQGQTEDGIVPVAAECDQPDAAAGKTQPEQGKDDCRDEQDGPA
jgi:hypothetical protein